MNNLEERSFRRALLVLDSASSLLVPLILIGQIEYTAKGFGLLRQGHAARDRPRGGALFTLPPDLSRPLTDSTELHGATDLTRNDFPSPYGIPKVIWNRVKSTERRIEPSTCVPAAVPDHHDVQEA